MTKTSSPWPRREDAHHSGWPPQTSIAVPKCHSRALPTTISSRPWPRCENSFCSGQPSRPPWAFSSWNIDYQRCFRPSVDIEMTSSTGLDSKQRGGNRVESNMSNMRLASQHNPKSDSRPNESVMTNTSIFAPSYGAKPASSSAVAEVSTESAAKPKPWASITTHRNDRETLASATTSRPGRPKQPPWGCSSWNTEYQKRLHSSARLLTNLDKKPSAKNSEDCGSSSSSVKLA